MPIHCVYPTLYLSSIFQPTIFHCSTSSSLFPSLSAFIQCFFSLCSLLLSCYRKNVLYVLWFYLWNTRLDWEECEKLERKKLYGKNVIDHTVVWQPRLRLRLRCYRNSSNNHKSYEIKFQVCDSNCNFVNGNKFVGIICSFDFSMYDLWFRQQQQNNTSTNQMPELSKKSTAITVTHVYCAMYMFFALFYFRPKISRRLKIHPCNFRNIFVGEIIIDLQIHLFDWLMCTWFNDIVT